MQPKNVEWKRQSVSQGVLVINDKVLLVANDYGARGILWSLPGGRLEPGEPHSEAVVREFKEETGLEVTVAGLVYVADAKTEIDRYHFVTCVFEVKLPANTPLDSDDLPQISCEGDMAVRQVRFVSFDTVPQLIQRPSIGEPLLNYLYYGASQMPIRYWSYPEYNTPDYVPISWPPTTLRV